MINQKSCFILGLPSAGKTSYLAALAYSLQQKQIKTKLCWNKFSEDHQYLTSLSETWLQYEPVSRTSIGLQKTELSLQLRDSDGNVFNITFPDLSGEIFQKQYIEREIDKELADHIINSNGILTFINPAEIIEPTLIPELPLTSRMDSDDLSPMAERNPAKIDPTEVQIVELLQDIDFLTDKKSRAIPLTIIVSAWDIVENTYSDPESCIKERTPLLWQFLQANDNVFQVSYYGVSAQGASLETGTNVEELLNRFEEVPAERIVVVDNTGKKSHDITLPLWEVMNK